MNESKNTEKLLKTMSSRLSSRDDCKNIEYKVNIKTEGKFTHISFHPVRYVYPSIHERKKSDIRIIEYHVIVNYFRDIQANVSDSGIVTQSNVFVDGEYIYKSSVDGRRRKWARA